MCLSVFLSPYLFVWLSICFAYMDKLSLCPWFLVYPNTTDSCPYWLFIILENILKSIEAFMLSNFSSYGKTEMKISICWKETRFNFDGVEKWKITYIKVSFGQRVLLKQKDKNWMSVSESKRKKAWISNNRYRERERDEWKFMDSWTQKN